MIAIAQKMTVFLNFFCGTQFSTKPIKLWANILVLLIKVYNIFIQQLRACLRSFGLSEKVEARNDQNSKILHNNPQKAKNFIVKSNKNFVSI